MPARASASLLLTALLALAALSCSAATPRIAPFHVRPDSPKSGHLMGPFTGQVKDEASGDPIPGALVYATWAYEQGSGVAQPSGFAEALASTDANGRYALSYPQTASLAGRLVSFYLVIYKKGYVAYRSDRRFSDFGPRLDFSQRHNAVRLTRWHSEHSHVRHLRYIGGGSALTALTAWERPEAAAELSGEGLRGSGRLSSAFMESISTQRLIAAQLLGETEIKGITGFEGSFESGPLNDQADTKTYSSQHFKALGQPESFDVAIRLWRLDGNRASERFEELASTLPGVSERDDIADRSLLALEGDIQGFAFMDKKRALVILITCGKGQCKSKNELIALAKKIYQNIEAVMPLTGP